MREIKFRFWSGTDMVYDIENVMECLKQQMAFDANVTTLIQYDHIGEHGASFMQFTGLRDKDKQEIYFGDICEVEVLVHRSDFSLHEIRTGVVQFTPSEGIILKVSKAWDVKKEKHVVPVKLTRMAAYRTKKIGNVHQNKHLLDEKTTN